MTGSLTAELPSVADLLRAFDETEVWRPIAGYPGYAVSSWGRIRGPRADVLSTTTIKGYHYVSLCREGAAKTARVHVCVARAFLGEPPFDDALVAHNDGDTDNNRVSNLRWASALENQADVLRHGNRVRGSAIHCARLIESDVPEIRRRALRGERYADIADDYGVSISTVSLIKLGRTWAHVS